MPMLALLAAAAFTVNPTVPLETSCADSLREARRYVVSGNLGRGLATLDSLVMRDGVTVAMETPGAMEDAVDRGLEAWNAGLGERTFRPRPAGTAADVVVRFVRSLDGIGADVQGLVDATREISWGGQGHNYRLHATIFVRDNVAGRPIRTDEVVNVVAHEAGHLLGLADVGREDRLMGPMTVGRPKGGPASEEVATVRDYRAFIRESYPKG